MTLAKLLMEEKGVVVMSEGEGKGGGKER